MPAKGQGQFSKSVSVYLDSATLAWVDAFVEKFKRDNPGMVCKRCDAIRALLTRLMIIDGAPTESSDDQEHRTP